MKEFGRVEQGSDEERRKKRVRDECEKTLERPADFSHHVALGDDIQ